LTLEGTADIAISGNLFSRVGPKAVAIKGEATRRVLFAGDVLSEVSSDHSKLRDSLVHVNLEAAPSK